MTTTAVIVATTSASTAVTGSIAAGEVKAFGAVGLRNSEFVNIEQSNAAGTVYSVIKYLSADGRHRETRLEPGKTLIQLAGPIDYRINKPVTANAVEIVEYS